MKSVRNFLNESGYSPACSLSALTYCFDIVEKSLLMLIPYSHIQQLLLKWRCTSGSVFNPLLALFLCLHQLLKEACLYAKCFTFFTGQLLTVSVCCMGAWQLVFSQKQLLTVAKKDTDEVVGIGKAKKAIMCH